MNLYERNYTQLKFERAGLFKTIRETYQCQEVLYPGCSVHITPSLYFAHVIYVDKSKAAAQFFADESSIPEFVSRNKQHKQPAYLGFIQQDYSKSLPLRKGTFDLVLSLFAGGIAKACAEYLKPGGLLLTNIHESDALDAVDNGAFQLVATIRFQKVRYVLVQEGLKDKNITAQKLNRKSLRQVNEGGEYVEHEVYYVFEHRA